MAYDELLADRVRSIFKEKKIVCEERKMMGGLCFMVDEKMCCGISKNELMCRIGKDFYEEALTKGGAKEMKFTGRPMRGFVFIEPEGIDMDDDLEYWVQLCIDFNPFAKKSPSKKKKK